MWSKITGSNGPQHCNLIKNWTTNWTLALKYVILQEQIQNSTLLENTEIKTNVLESCSKNEPAANIKSKGIKTIDSYAKEDYMPLPMDLQTKF